MCRKRALASLLLCFALPGWIATLAATTDGGLPDRYIQRGFDGSPVLITNDVDGRTWAAWSYRSCGEFDIALAYRDGHGLWSEPTFLGRFDGRDQIQPTLAADGSGNVYVAYRTTGSGQITVSVLPIGTAEWRPYRVFESGLASSRPALRVTSGGILLAYLVSGRIAFVEFPFLAPPVITHGIQEGPDGVDPLGQTASPANPDGSTSPSQGTAEPTAPSQRSDNLGGKG
jgi:hypothetical protein